MPDVFSTKGGNKGGPILSGKPGVITDVAGIILDRTGKGKPKSTRTQKIPGLPGLWACVDMKSSPYAWDRKLADTDESGYNCHYYTRAAMGLTSRWGNMTDLNTKALPGMGYVKVDLSRAQDGDIILVEEPAQGGGVSLGFSHSGVVTDAINGSINNIRQKASPGSCVIDTSFYDFKSAFGRDPKYVSLWRKK